MSVSAESRYIGRCCREWVLHFAAAGKGKCGLCGERPEYVRPFNLEVD